MSLRVCVCVCVCVCYDADESLREATDGPAAITAPSIMNHGVDKESTCQISCTLESVFRPPIDTIRRRPLPPPQKKNAQKRRFSCNYLRNTTTLFGGAERDCRSMARRRLFDRFLRFGPPRRSGVLTRRGRRFIERGAGANGHRAGRRAGGGGGNRGGGYQSDPSKAPVRWADDRLRFFSFFHVHNQ